MLVQGLAQGGLAPGDARHIVGDGSHEVAQAVQAAGDAILAGGQSDDLLGQAPLGLLQLPEVGPDLLPVGGHGRDALAQFFPAALHHLMQGGVLPGDGCDVGGRPLRDAGNLADPVLQVPLVLIQRDHPLVYRLVPLGDGLMERPLLVPNGGDAGGKVLVVAVELLDALLGLVVVDVDLGGDCRKLPGVGGDHRLQSELVFLHPCHPVAATGDAEHQCRQGPEEDG